MEVSFSHALVSLLKRVATPICGECLHEEVSRSHMKAVAGPQSDHRLCMPSMTLDVCRIAVGYIFRFISIVLICLLREL